MTVTTTEVFFRPAELARERITIPAALYNSSRLLLARCEYAHVFVPVRSMQLLAVIDDNEVIFVDKEAYAVEDGEGGRLILLAWGFQTKLPRDNLSSPADIELVYYAESARELHGRLVGELGRALAQMEARARVHGCEPRAKKVLPFRRS